VEPIKVQVIAYAPTVFRHCQHCEVAFEGIGLGQRIHRDEARDALPEDLLNEFQLVSDWVHGLLERHPAGVSVTVVDAASVEGVWTSLRHGVRRYPSVLVDGERHPLQSDHATLDATIDQRVRAHARREEGVMPKAQS
jgi:hypothetical protein